MYHYLVLANLLHVYTQGETKPTYARIMEFPSILMYLRIADRPYPNTSHVVPGSFAIIFSAIRKTDNAFAETNKYQMEYET